MINTSFVFNISQESCLAKWLHCTKGNKVIRSVYFYWFWKIVSWIKYTPGWLFCSSCARSSRELNCETITRDNWFEGMIYPWTYTRAHAHLQNLRAKPTRTCSKSRMLISLCTTMLIHLLRRQVEFHLSTVWFVAAI